MPFFDRKPSGLVLLSFRISRRALAHGSFKQLLMHQRLDVKRVEGIATTQLASK